MPPPKLAPPPAPPGPPAAATRKVSFGKIAESVGHRVLLYGPGGVGKTSLAVQAPGPVAFFDLDESLPRLKSQLTELPLVIEVDSWTALRASLQSSGWESVNTIVIDSITKAEELCVAHTLATITTEGGKHAGSIEGYGYGRGYGFVFDTFLPLLGDLDRHSRAGRNVILIAHDCTATVPNPSGEDWLRYEPRLQNPTSGKASIRLRTKEWTDHTLFMGYDVIVDKEGKGKGGGTRTIWPAELPHCMAKSRTTQAAIPLEDGAALWASILK